MWKLTCLKLNAACKKDETSVGSTLEKRKVCAADTEMCSEILYDSLDLMLAKTVRGIP